ncbi:MAG: TolC family protein, partial [Candidatus Accumulibacter sp.]|nr:TolC family protein [Accumulibacter sp.]
FDRDVAALIAEARERRPDMKAAEAELRAAQAGIAYARAAGRPTISLSGGPQWQDLGELSSHGNAIGLTFSVPIFSGFNTTYNIRAAEARSDVQAARLDDTRQQVALDVWEAYQSLSTASQTIRSTVDLLASAEQSERVALGRYKAGVGNILDVLNAQSALATARLQRIQAMLDWHVSRATLARAIGILDSSLLLSVGRDRKNRNP